PAVLLLEKHYGLLLGLALGVSAALAWARRFVTDDAFISFRYAKNFSNGLGLVYNAGEYVEGYTNFLWTLLIAAGLRVGADPVMVSQALGIAAYLGTIVVILWLAGRAGQKVFLPLAALALLVDREMHIWATGGLETSLVTFLITAGFVRTVTAESHRALLVGGSLLGAAALTRPDALLIYLSTLAFVLLWRRDIRAALWLALPLVCVYLPYWIWRFSYYGHIFPNTYYAKSVALSWWSQGFAYLWLYLKTYYALLSIVALIPLAAVILFSRLRRAKESADRLDERIQVGALALALPYVLSVVRVGGDFMFARLLIPVTPLFLLALEAALRRYLPRLPAHLTALALVVLCFFFPNRQFDGLGQINHIADESRYYPPERFAEERRIGQLVRLYFAKTDARVGFYGMRATMVYYAEPTLAVECQAGLTDEYIAHLPLERRGRPGHEKEAPLEYLYERELHFLLKTVYDFTLPEDKRRALQIGDFTTYILTYDNRVMESLRTEPDIAFVHFPTFLDEYIATMPTLSPERVARDYREFKRYYFDHNDDVTRERPFMSFLDPSVTNSADSSSK
ncbi:MAG TPA: hypothetical protein VLB27_03290, partial [candidate division Zixibacteria bacterium]|nr:hypothetical protein [candidate division Zixibacteria bacterium]